MFAWFAVDPCPKGLMTISDNGAQEKLSMCGKSTPGDMREGELTNGEFMSVTPVGWVEGAAVEPDELAPESFVVLISDTENFFS